MLRELYIEKIVIELKEVVLKSKSKTFREFLDRNNIDKENIGLEEIRRVIIKCDKGEIDNILKELGYTYKISDIEIIDKYLKNKNSDNEKVLSLIDRIYKLEVNKRNSLLKEEINKLYEFKSLIDNGLYPDELVRKFGKVKKCKNKYYQLIEIENVMKSNKGNIKEMVLIYLTYKYRIDDKLEEVFRSVDISREEVIEFVRKLEGLDNKRLENLFCNYKYWYYDKYNLRDKYEELSNKVMVEYSKYYDDNFYFRMKDFVKDYNSKYDDDFGLFLFKSDKSLLTEEMVFSLFKRDDIVSNYFLFKDNSDIKVFSKLDYDSKKKVVEQEDIYKRRKKFYKKYKNVLNKFMNDPSICFKYFMVKYVDDCDKGEFYELFKSIYKDNYKEIENKKVSTKDKVSLLKRDFVSEIVSSEFKDRYLVSDKYRGYAMDIGCDSQIKDNYYDVIIGELERSYYLLVARNVVVKLRNAIDNRLELYNLLNEYVKSELGFNSLDELFSGLAKKHNELKKEYFRLRDSVSGRKLSKRKSVK